MKNRSERKQMSVGFTFNSFVERLKKENIEVEFSNEDKELIEWQLLKYDKILFEKLKEISLQFGVKKFLIVVQKKGKICWYDFSLDKVGINLSHAPDSSDFNNALQMATKLAQGMSPTRQKGR